MTHDELTIGRQGFVAAPGPEAYSGGLILEDHLTPCCLHQRLSEIVRLGQR